MAKHFKANEFKYPELLSPKLLQMLDATREKAEVAMTITGSWRPRPNVGKRSSGHQPNGRGIYEAVDIRCPTSRKRFRMVKAAFEVGFRRIGVYDRHIHLDCVTEISNKFGQDVNWIGISKGKLKKAAKRIK